MPRKLIIKQSRFPYHVWNRSIDKRFFSVPMEWLWRVFCDEAYAVSLMWNARIHSLVLMGNHYHMLISTPDSNISECMGDFQSEIARAISLRFGTDGYRFQSRYKWSIIKSPEYFSLIWRYVYQNPIAAKICSRSEEYPYSSLHGLLGQGPLRLPIQPCDLAPQLFEEPTSEFLSWLNTQMEPDTRERLRKGLRSETFVPSLRGTSRSQRSKIEEEFEP